MTRDITVQSVVEIETRETPAERRPVPGSSATAVRIGAVRFLNTLPLIHGLDTLRHVTIGCTVPSLLIDELISGETDLALCSSIDYQRSSEPLVIVPVGVLACAGPTLTVRLYSTRPIEEIEEVHCDTDSHTSVALMQILLAERYNVRPKCIAYEAREHVANNKPLPWPDAMLLIGDKVVTDSPPAVRYPHQLDLGELWFDMTGKPFVFAAWMALKSADQQRVAMAAAALDRQRRHNAMRLDQMVAREAPRRGWPIDLARQYLTKHLRFAFDESAAAGLELFFEKAHAHGLAAAPGSPPGRAPGRAPGSPLGSAAGRRPIEIMQW